MIQSVLRFFGSIFSPRDPRVLRVTMAFVTLALVLLGLVMIFSASSIKAVYEGESATSYLTKQLMFAAVGGMVAVVCAFMPGEFWRNPIIVTTAVALAYILLIATAIWGIEELGAKRWLAIGPASMQPSEFAKISFVLAMAYLWDALNRGVFDIRTFLVYGAVALLMPLAILYMAQSDLGTTCIILVGIIAVLWLGELPSKYFFLAIALILLFGVGSILGTGYRSARFAYLDPWNDGNGGYGDGWQIIQSYCALANGGLFGVGIGNSTQKYLYLPYAETDFIFAVIGEELGFIGAFAVIFLFLVFLWAGLMMARTLDDTFKSTLVGGLTAMIVFQAFLNIGCVVGLFPVTGKPLPFISSGGSSVIASLMMVGIIISVARSAGTGSIHQRRRDDFRVVRMNGASGALGRFRGR